MASLLKKLVDQVNVFDGGKSWSNQGPARTPAPSTNTAAPRVSVGVARPQGQVRVQQAAPRPVQPMKVVAPVVQPRVNMPKTRPVLTDPTDIAMRNLQDQVKAGKVNPNVAAAKIRALGVNSGVQDSTASQVTAPTTPVQMAGQKVINNLTNRKVAPVALGIGRSGVGTIEGLSGLYDLATKGKGTNRVGKWAQRSGAAFDKTVNDERYNKLAYKGAQAGADIAQFIAPGAASAKIAGKIGTVASKAPGATKLIGAVDDVAKNGNRIQKFAANTAKYAARPDNVVNIVSDTALNSGLRSNRGQDVSAGTVALDAGTSLAFGRGLDIAGKGVAKAASGVRKGMVNKGLAAPFRGTGDEMVSIKNVARERQGWGPASEADHAVSQYALTRQGINPYDFTTVDHLIGAQHRFDTRKLDNQYKRGEAAKRVKNVFSPLVRSSNSGHIQAGMFDPLGVSGKGGNKQSKEWAKTRTDIQKRLAEAIRNGADDKIAFGNLSAKKLKRANEILAANGETLIDDKSLFVHPAVIDKLADKRIDTGSMTPEQLADFAYSAIHNSSSKVVPSKYSHGVGIVKPSDHSKLTYAGVAPFDGAGSVKTVHLRRPNQILEDMKKNQGVPGSGSTSGGGGVPPSLTEGSGRAPISDRRGTVHTIPNKNGNVNANQPKDPRVQHIIDTETGYGNLELDRNAGSSAKAAGYRGAALQRALDGKLTPTEVRNIESYLNTNYVGKQIPQGQIVGTSFGNVRVKTADGTIVSVRPEDIAAPRVTEQDILAFAKQKAEADIARMLPARKQTAARAEAPKPVMTDNDIVMGLKKGDTITHSTRNGQFIQKHEGKLKRAWVDPNGNGWVSVSYGKNQGGQEIVNKIPLNQTDQYSQPKTIRDLVSSKFEPYRRAVVTIYEKANTKAARAFKEATGIDIEGYRHSMDSYSARHALNDHANDQIPLKPEDLELAPEIIKSADEITYGGKTQGGNGLDTIVYKKIYGDRAIYVEEVRTGKKELATKTMYWQPIAKEKSTLVANPQQAADSSRALPRQADSALVANATIDNIPNSTPVVNGSAPQAPKPDPKLSELGGNRPQNDLMKRYEQARNAGDTATMREIEAQVPDKAMLGISVGKPVTQPRGNLPQIKSPGPPCQYGHSWARADFLHWAT